MMLKNKLGQLGGMGRLAGRAVDTGRQAYRRGQQGVNMARTHADNGNLFLFLAFFIAVVDYLGEGRYTGFEWVFGFENIDILTQIITSGVRSEEHTSELQSH